VDPLHLVVLEDLVNLLNLVVPVDPEVLLHLVVLEDLVNLLNLVVPVDPEDQNHRLYKQQLKCYFLVLM
jgi:hypothetical protein